MPYSMEMRTRLQRSPVAQLGQIILRGLADNTSVDITSLEHLSRETDLHAVDILPLSKRYRDISIDITYYRSIRCTWLNRKNAADKGVLVYIHGGGFVVGVLGSQWRWLAEVLLRTGMAAVVIHYETFS